MKINSPFYHISELLDRWKGQSVTEIDLIRQGHDGKLQFSMWIVPPEEFNSLRVECYCAEDGVFPLVPTNRNELQSKNPQLFKIEKSTITRILCNTRPQNEQPEKQSDCSTIADLLPDCKKCVNKCLKRDSSDKESVRVRIPEPQYVDENGDEVENSSKLDGLLRVTARDLVVTLDEVKRFEQEELKITTALHRYLDPDALGYSHPLAVAIELWRSVYENKDILDTVSARQAAFAFIEKNYGSLKNNKNKIVFHDHLKLMTYSVALQSLIAPSSWKKYLEEHVSPKKSDSTL